MLRSTIAGCTVVIAVAALSHVGPSAQQRVEPGDPLPGMTPAEFEEFRLGPDDFLEVETAEEGLAGC